MSVMASTSKTFTSVSPIASKASPNPSTPVAARSKSEATPSPGNWRHPAWREIARRQKAQVFDQTNINKIVLNFLFVVAIWNRGRFAYITSPLFAYLVAPFLSSLPTWIRSWLYINYALYLYLFSNIFYALRPFFIKPDNITDVDLNATQRRLLGLDPKATPPPTANTTYVTPPKYARSSTPRTSSSSYSYGSPSNSIGSLSTPSRSPLQRAASTGHSADWRSPVLRRQAAERKILEQQKEEKLFDSLAFARTGTPPLSGSGGHVFTPAGSLPHAPGSYRLLPAGLDSTPAGGSIFAPSTPSPVGRQASVPLNNKWLYERGRRSSSGSRLSLG